MVSAHDLPMTTVHCTVSNCEYWAEQNHCSADEILVAGPGLPPTEQVNHHGRGTENHRDTPADRKDGTYCYTFEDEGGEKHGATARHAH